jgi:DNA-3-methyladenine glycosylase II
MARRPTSPHARACRHLRKCDPILNVLIAAVGLCTLESGGDPFTILVRSIVSQLISTAAARTIYARLHTAVGEAGMTAAAIIALGHDDIRKQGLSSAKSQGVLDLACRSLDGRLPLDRLAEMDNADIFTHLVAVRGIGVWTAEMFLIFGLGRPDILPVGDLGLRAGIQTQYALEALPNAAEVRRIAEPWAPYRSVATWYIWRSRGLVPQSG